MIAEIPDGVGISSFDIALDVEQSASHIAAI